MKYSKEQLEAMSDLQLNRVIAFELFKLTPDQSIIKHQDSGKCTRNYKDSAVSVGEFGCLSFGDYVSDYSLMMPLVFEAGISLISSGGGWYTAHSDDLDVATIKCSHESYCSNPLRAAAIVYILVKQGE